MQFVKGTDKDRKKSSVACSSDKSNAFLPTDVAKNAQNFTLPLPLGYNRIIFYPDVKN